MILFRKNKDKKKELEEIKNTVKGENLSNVPLPPPPPPQPSPQPSSNQPLVPKPPEKKITPDMAPLFVKIDRYREVLKKLQELKMLLKRMTRLISLSYEVDEIKGDVTERIRDATSKITDTLISLDEIFVKPEEYRPESLYERKTQEFEGQMFDLQEELRHLRRELSK
ncbi:MAG: hypothetical protein J7L45_03160, partial [Candidatus Aenigmarchaeota archaeon]|nr:hypothetical protein [Candidatus Aenigmarchaeota archaeon]